MKKISVLFFIILLFVGCTQTSNKEETIPTETTISTEIAESTTEKKNEEATEETVLNYEHDIVPNWALAEEVATVIFKHAKKPEGTENYKVIEVIEPKQNDYWVVFLSDGDLWDIFYAETDFCCISIDRKTGKVIELTFITAEEQAERIKQNGHADYYEQTKGDKMYWEEMQEKRIEDEDTKD